MLREIVVGRKYRLNIQPNAEYRCLSCDKEIVPQEPGATSAAKTLQAWQGRIVTVVQYIDGLLRHGSGCGGIYPAPEGLWACAMEPGGIELTTVYLWLEPLEEESNV